jgi:superfamily II DNA or RNA helicase
MGERFWIGLSPQRLHGAWVAIAAESVDLQPLMSAIREAAGDRRWSAGVVLARDGRVIGVSDAGDEIVLSVAVPGASQAIKVWLWPKDEEWVCGCDQDACVHAAAAIIALSRARGAGKALPKPRSLPTIRYALRREDRDLRLTREVVAFGEGRPLKGGLRQSGAALTDADHRVEKALSMGDRNLPAAVWRRILEAWAEAGSAVTLDGEPVTISAEPLRPVAVVRDHGEGFRVSLHRASEVSESFRGGVMRVGDTLRPSEEGGLAPAQRRALVSGLDFAPEEVGRLVSETLPRLETVVTVKVKTDRLPSAHREPPRARLTLTPSEHALEVTADIVYGDPPVARVEGGRLALLGGAVPLRDRSAERELAEGLDRALEIPLGRPWRMERDAALDFVRRRLPRFRGEVRGDPGPWRVREAPARVRLERGGGALGLRVVSEARPDDLAEAWALGRALVPLIDGGWAPLPEALLEREGHRVLDLLQAADERGELPAHAAGPAAALAGALPDAPAPDLGRLAPLVEGFEGIEEAPLPQGLRAELRPYQRFGVSWMAFLRRAGLSGILADDMGLGKTLQALCAIAAVEAPSLVVAPTSVLRNWVNEAARFLPGVETCLFHGPGRSLDEGARLVVTSYAIARLDDRLKGRRWGYVVLDEAQAIKNPDSQTARAVFALDAEHRLSLTGTPVENRLEELWSQLRFLMPGFLGSRDAFRERYARPAEAGDLAAARALRERIRPFVLRRLKQDVARDLPPRTDVVRYCDQTPAQQQATAAVRAAARAEVAEALGAGRTLEVLEYLLRLRQAACHAALLPGRDAGPPERDSGKLTLLLEELEQVVEEGHKALVFSQWTGFLDLIQEALTERGLGWQRLDGATRDRQALVDRFQSEGGPPVFLISLKAGGTGLNLTAADYVFHTDPWWNPAVEDQATDRAHRIGQTRPVISVKLVTTGTVEEKILALQEAKRQLAGAAVGDEAGFVQGLTRDDLRQLLA